MSLRILLAAPLALLTGLAALPASAQSTEMGHAMMQAPDGASEAIRLYVDAMNRMSMAMGAEFTGNADIDFIAGMIPHHQGAVDAARVVLEHGTDPDVRAFAEQVIAAQEAEIAWMQAWLAAQK